MPRKPNYGLNKRRKEQERQAKKDAKMMDKQQRRDERSLPRNVEAQSTDASSGHTPPSPPPDEEL